MVQYPYTGIKLGTGLSACLSHSRRWGYKHPCREAVSGHDSLTGREQIPDSS